jgi:Mg-chelatase subunit ChlD
MKDYDWLVKNGTTISKDILSKNIEETEKSLQAKLKELRPMGGTALGPGLLTSVAMAGEGSPGSIVILCTDGMATDGLGAF